jgi:hypothetical protein
VFLVAASSPAEAMECGTRESVAATMCPPTHDRRAHVFAGGFGLWVHLRSALGLMLRAPSTRRITRR